MGDEWPWGGPRYTTYDACVRELKARGMDDQNANIGAAIANPESSYDWMVLNNTPATGDYSVGIWQINYYAGLYTSRVQAFGTPRHLARSGVRGQSAACYALWQQSGWNPWPEWASGSYKQYLHGGGGGGGGGTPPGPAEPTIRQGDTGAAVTTLQLDLDDLGAKLTADGVFGPLTAAAVRSFQASHDLTADGVVGPQTWNALYQAIEGTTPPLPNPGPPSSPPPPNEPPQNIAPDALRSWSVLQSRTGPEAAAALARLAGYANTVVGSRK